MFKRVGIRPRESIRVATSRETELLRQQNVLAQFGEHALRVNNLDEILQQACSLAREGFGSDLAKVMELQDDGVTLLVRAGVGWQPGIVGTATVKAEEGSSEGYALKTGHPAISTNIDTEQRFSYPKFIRDAGVKALVNVIIIGPEGKQPYGILQVDSRRPRDFTEDDTNFLRGYANLIAAAVERLRVTAEAEQAHASLQQSENRYRAIVEVRDRLCDHHARSGRADHRLEPWRSCGPGMGGSRGRRTIDGADLPAERPCRQSARDRDAEGLAQGTSR